MSMSCWVWMGLGGCHVERGDWWVWGRMTEEKVEGLKTSREPRVSRGRGGIEEEEGCLLLLPLPPPPPPPSSSMFASRAGSLAVN